jgi:hypothetical protein
MSTLVSSASASTYTTLTAKPINYGVVQLSWNSITDTNLPSIYRTVNTTYPSFTLVRKVSGYPQGITDGDVLRTVDNYPPAPPPNDPVFYTNFGTKANYFVFDNGVSTSYDAAPLSVTSTKYQGHKLYYALFLTYPDTGTVPFRNKKIAEASVTFVKDTGTLDFMLSNLPEVYKKDSSGSFNQDLSDFLSLFAFHYDLYKTQVDDLFKATSVTESDENLVKLLLKQFGASYEDIQDLTTARSLLKNVIYLYQTSGSREGILEFVKNYTGYGASITNGKNLIHDYDSSSFEESMGSWYPVVDAATAPYGNAYANNATRTSILTKVGPVATGTSTIGSFNNKQGVSLTGAVGVVGSTTITVDSTAGLIAGSAIEYTANPTYLSPNTVVVSVDSITTFTVNTAPLTAFTGATLASSSNMVTGMMKATVVNSGDNSFSIRPKILKVSSAATIGDTTLTVAPNIVGVNEYIIGDGIPYATRATAVNATTSVVTLSKPITKSIAANAEVWSSGSSFDKAGAATQFLPISAPGQPHTFSIYFNRAGNTARDIKVQLRWRNVDGSVNIADTAVTVAAASQSSGTTWYRATVTGTAPTAAAWCEPIVTIASAVAADIYFFDCAQWQYGVNVYSAGIQSNVVTVTTTEAHGFTAGDTVRVAIGTSYDGAYTIASVPTTTTFTYAKTIANDTDSKSNCYGSTQVIYIPTTPINEIPIGSTVTVTSGTGAFATSTTVLAVLNTQAVYVSAVPTTALSNATITFSQKVASRISSTSKAKVSAVIPFEDARKVNINVLAQYVNQITDQNYWHSSTDAVNFLSANNTVAGVKTAGTLSFSFSSGSGPFSSISDTLDKSIQIISAVGSGNSITYTTAGIHEFLPGFTPTVYNTSLFYANDLLNAGRGNGFDIKPVNSASVPITSTTSTSFTVTKAPLTLTGVTSGTSVATGSFYIEVGDANYNQLWVGAKVVVSGGAGNLSESLTGQPLITSVTKVEYNSSTSRYDRFYLDYAPKQALSNSTITASLGTGGLSTINFNAGLPTAVISYGLSAAKGRNIYYNNASTDAGTFKGMAVTTGVPYTFALKKSHTDSVTGYSAYSPILGNYVYSGLMAVPYISFTNGITANTKIPMISFVKNISRTNNVTKFTTSGTHNFKVGDLLYLSNVKVTPPGLGSLQINYSNDSSFGSTSGTPYYVESTTSSSFSARHFYRNSIGSPTTYDLDGNDFPDTAVDLVPNGSTYYPPIAGFAVTDRSERFLSMTATPYPTSTVVNWDPDNYGWKYAIPGLYLVELFKTPRIVSNVALTANVLTVTTDVAHGYAAGQSVVIAGLTNGAGNLSADDDLNGTYTIVSTPLTTTFTVAKTHADITSHVPNIGGTASVSAQVNTHTINISATLFSASTEFKYYFDGITDPNNRVGGYLDTLWGGTAGASQSHYYLNLASVSNRLKKIIPNVIPYANKYIGTPNSAAILTSAAVNSSGTQITFTSASEHNLILDSTVSVTGFTGNTAVNVTGGNIISIVSPTKFVVAPPSAISTAAVTGTGTAYVTNGWANLYHILYADPTYESPYSYGYGFRYGIFTLNSSVLDGSDTLK